jgi:uncharacterized protein (TIGR03085 family)
MTLPIGAIAGYHAPVTDFAPQERAALADLMAELGPDAPTLCAGWTTRDLAAHLIVRGSRPDAAAGILIPAFAAHTKRVQDEVAKRPWPELVEGARKRPWWATFADEVINRIEYFVHHEDVRRAQPDWKPRPESAEFSAALWSRVPMQAKLALRRTPATITVIGPGIGEVTAGAGGPQVRLVAPVPELVLFLFGRQAHSLVELTGPEEITSRMRTAAYGI